MMSKKTNISIRKLSASMFFALGLIGLESGVDAMMLDLTPDSHVALGVSDLDELIKKLDAAGVSYTLSQSGRRALFCRDPDDNALEFIANS
jgi:catechol 2,3-dioxygenase-like lactoylglutathione lyase family enzyme